MRLEDFDFDDPDHASMLIGVAVRNAMEKFHCEIDGLTDGVMADLNKAVRVAVYEVMNDPTGEQLTWLILAIPGYWERPSDLVREKGVVA